MSQRSVFCSGYTSPNLSACFRMLGLAVCLLMSAGCSVFSGPLDKVMRIEDDAARVDAFVQLRDSLPEGSPAQIELIEDALNAFNDTRGLVLRPFVPQTDGTSLHLGQEGQPDPARLADVTDITVFTGMHLDTLSIQHCPNLRDFDVLKSMKIKTLRLDGCTGFRDPRLLNEIEGLQSASLSKTGSLSPSRVKRQWFDHLDFSHSHMVKFLRGLQGKTIVHLSLDGLERMQDFSPFSEMQIDASLSLSGTPIDDLKPLRDQPLRHLNLDGCKNLRSLAGLEAMPNLQSVSLLRTHLDPKEVDRIRKLLPKVRIAYDPPPASVLNTQTLEQIMQIQDHTQRLQAFIKLRDSLMPYSSQQTELIQQALNAFNQTQGVEFLVRRLDDGAKTLHLRGNGYLYPERAHPTDAITDISVFTGMSFDMVDLAGMKKIEDFSVLETMQIKTLSVKGCRGWIDVSVLNRIEGLKKVGMGSTDITDLRPLQIDKLDSLNLSVCLKLRSLEGLEGMTIGSLSLNTCRALEDISALCDMRSLRWLDLSVTPVSDLTPLRRLELEHLNVSDCKSLRSLSGIKKMESLRTLFISGSGLPESEVQRLQWRNPELEVSGL